MSKHILIISALAALSLLACEQKENTAAPEATPSTDTAAKAEATETPKTETKSGEDAKPAAPTTTGDAKQEVLGLGKTPEDIEPGAKNLYGGAFTMEGDPIPLSDALVKAADGEGPYKISAKIKKVCQKKGCWMTLHDDKTKLPIRVKMKDYGFFVPMNANDLPTVAEGTLKKVTVPQDVAQHYADDEAEATGKPPEKIDGPQESFEFTARAVQIENPKT